MTIRVYHTNSLSVTLPWPDTHLSPNSREHYQVKAGFVRAAKHAAELAARAQTLPTLKPPLFWHVEIYPPDFRRRDADNVLASLKPSFDGIMLALGIDDKMKFITSGSWHVGETKTGGLVVITIGEDH